MARQAPLRSFEEVPTARARALLPAPSITAGLLADLARPRVWGVAKGGAMLERCASRGRQHKAPRNFDRRALTRVEQGPVRRGRTFQSRRHNGARSEGRYFPRRRAQDRGGVPHGRAGAPGRQGLRPGRQGAGRVVSVDAAGAAGPPAGARPGLRSCAPRPPPTRRPLAPDAGQDGVRGRRCLRAGPGRAPGRPGRAGGVRDGGGE
jgi:hypothetical protein